MAGVEVCQELCGPTQLKRRDPRRARGVKPGPMGVAVNLLQGNLRMNWESRNKGGLGTCRGGRREGVSKSYGHKEEWGIQEVSGEK